MKAETAYAQASPGGHKGAACAADPHDGAQHLGSMACLLRQLSACAQAETAYTQACLADTKELQAELYREMRGAIQEADQTAPVRCAGADAERN